MTCIILTLSLFCNSEQPIEPFISEEVANISPDPKNIYYSNPDLIWDDKGVLLLHDIFGGAHGIVLMRRNSDGWHQVAKIPDAMHSHLIYLPDKELYLILGVRQKPKSICLWHSRDGKNWSDAIELFGGAEYHAGSTPWAIYDGRVFVPFEVRMTRHWGSYQYGAVHASLDNDLTDPASWTYAIQRVPWSALPGCSACGGLEGNLIVAPDGNLYNILRIPGHSRLGKARWNGLTFEWEGLVQGVHNQSKHELFTDPVTDKVYLLANGWPERADKAGPHRHGYRNALCLWEATEPDLSHFRLLRVVNADRNPLHAFSYVAGMLDPEGRLWIAERNGDDNTKSYHDTNRIVIRMIDDFRQWIDEPALIPYGNDQVDENGVWRKKSVLDGLLISHFPNNKKISFPLTAKTTIRIAQLAQDETPVDLLGFATCDLIVISAFRLHGDQLTLWSGSEEWNLRELSVGKPVDLELSLLSPTTVNAKVNGDVVEVKPRGKTAAAENIPTNVPSHPSLVGILPRDEAPDAKIGCIEVISGPTVKQGTQLYSSPPTLPELRVLADGVSAFGKLSGNKSQPVPNHARPETGVMGGFVGFRNEYTGQLRSRRYQSSGGKPSVIVPIAKNLREITFGGFVQGLSLTEKPCVVGALTSDIGNENKWNENADYFAVTLALREDKPTLGIVYHRDGQKIKKSATSPVYAAEGMPCTDTTRFFFAVSLFEHDDGLEIKLYQANEILEKVGQACRRGRPVLWTEHWNLYETELPPVSYFVALISPGESETQLRSSGGLFLSSKFLNKNELVPVAESGFLTLLDR